MALDLQFPNFDQTLVTFGQWITAKCARLVFQGLPYLYEAIGNRIAPQVGGSKIVAGHDHGSLYGGAYISRTGVCFSSGGRDPLFTASWDGNSTGEYSEISAFTSPTFGWDTTPITTLGGTRVLYASPGIMTWKARSAEDQPVYLDMRVRFYWAADYKTHLQFKVVCRDASDSASIWAIPAERTLWISTESSEIAGNSAQQEVRLKMPVRGDWWNNLELYVKREVSPKSEVLYIYDIAIAETYRMSQPVSRGRQMFR